MYEKVISLMFKVSTNIMMTSNIYKTVIHVFSKFLQIVPLKRKTGKAVTSTFQTIFKDPKYLKPIRRQPVWVRTDKGKEFLNKSFQDMLKREGLEFQICRNPEVKCSVIERARRTIRDKLYKYFTYKNTYSFIDVIQKFLQGYNTTIHSTNGMAPVRVTDSDVLAIWTRMNKKDRKIPTAKPRYRRDMCVLVKRK
jgi:transposase InsO family protein